LTKNVNCYSKEDFRGQVATLYSLRQVIGAYGGFPAKVEPGCG
jgi:hypothetical protein